MTSEKGIAYDHAYTLLGTLEISDGTRLVHMRNPWGHELWKGDWSDQSPLWTDELKTKVDDDWNDDGKFYMSIEDYYNEFMATWINWPTEEMHEAHFLVLDDENTKSPGKLPWCGETCTLHEFELISTEEQTVYLSAHTWPTITLPPECNVFDGKINLL